MTSSCSTANPLPTVNFNLQFLKPIHFLISNVASSTITTSIKYCNSLMALPKSTNPLSLYSTLFFEKHKSNHITHSFLPPLLQKTLNDLLLLLQNKEPKNSQHTSKTLQSWPWLSSLHYFPYTFSSFRPMGLYNTGPCTWKAPNFALSKVTSDCLLWPPRIDWVPKRQSNSSLAFFLIFRFLNFTFEIVWLVSALLDCATALWSREHVCLSL